MYKWLNTVLCIFAVTPHAGVRIEIFSQTPAGTQRTSPLTRGCELKFGKLVDVRLDLCHPSRGGAN